MAKRPRQSRKPTHKTVSRPSSNPSAQKQAPPKKPSKPSAPHQKPYIPFTQDDHILLVGEGDFSYAHSLLLHHADKFSRLFATTYESAASLAAKHPRSSDAVVALGPDDVAYGVDARALKRSSKTLARAAGPDSTRDAGGRREEGFDWVVWNFPHSGGVSTDVNRQVRRNQELLVGFFESAKEVLRPPGRGGEAAGKILVTLFEGEPYTLWNVRDLARHTGYVVERSFRFPVEAYEGYTHARTLGDIKSTGEVADKEEEWNGFSDNEIQPEVKLAKEAVRRPGAWRGEERPARSYIFEVRKEDKSGQRAKRKREQDSDSDEG